MAAFIINQSGALAVSQELYVSPFDVSNQFSLAVFGITAIGGGILGLIGLLTRQYTFASGAILIWVIGLMLPVTQWFLAGVPMILGVLLPTEISYLTYVVSAFFAFILFMFMAEIATQRQIT